ncbi:MAG: lipocalin family protein [Chryseobacterium sp.]|jgi:hypothetical protein|uniref:lipocalin family protein n=1 Tax=Chryseobacterium sp. TaxID=1871047 RepID=UPI00283721A9|nr:lipocalin family protein [Chryseobacterium sp.]MDR2237784.1 lipocalin family protein [Chryseobacterium sp.]
MKFILNLIILLSLASCSNDTRDNSEEITLSVNGVWKPVQYEYKGKSYPIGDCEKKSQILINTDYSGVYESYIKDEVSGNCINPDSFSGKWNYDKLYNILTLSYTEGGVPKTLKKDIEGLSDIELRISDSSKNVDGLAGNDDAVLVYKREF